MFIGEINPFENATSNTMELFNESSVLITTYHLYMFNDFFIDAGIRTIIGRSLIIFTCFNVAVNFGMVILGTLSLLARKLKLGFLEWRKAR
jgi:hypothetical protein